MQKFIEQITPDIEEAYNHIRQNPDLQIFYPMKDVADLKKMITSFGADIDQYSSYIDFYLTLPALIAAKDARVAGVTDIKISEVRLMLFMNLCVLNKNLEEITNRLLQSIHLSGEDSSNDGSTNENS